MTAVLRSFLSLAARVPGMAYVVLLVVLFLGAGVVGIYHRGERAGVRKVAMKAVTDSVTRATAAVDTAMHRADVAHGVDQQAGRRRQALRQRIEILDSSTVRIGAAVLSAPLPLIQLVHADDEKIGADSVTIGGLLAERAARQSRDTVVEHREHLETAIDGGGVSVKEIAVVAVLLEAVHQLLRLLVR